MENRILIIANPKAGRGKIVKEIDKIKENLQKLSYQVKVQYTDLQKDATQIIKSENEPYDKLLVCGGDGTLNQAIQGLCEMEKQVPVGYMTVGTTNDFARSLGVSKNRYDISNHIDEYQEEQVDVGKFNERFFNYVASIGVFSKASYRTSTKAKNRFGRLAYLFLGVRELFFYPTYHLKIFTEDRIIEDEFVYGSISNARYVGGFPIFKKETVDMSDGEFEAIFVKKPKNIWQTLKIAAKVLSGHLQDKNVCHFKTAHLKIETTEDTEWSIDGEYSGKVKNIEISNLPKNRTYLVPKKKGEK